MHGADVDDPARFACRDQPLGEVLRQEERPFQVYVQHLVVVRFRYLGKCRLLFHAGIVDQDVDGAELVVALIHQRAYLVEVSDIGLHNDALGAGLFDPVQRFLGTCRSADVVDNDLGTFFGELTRDSLSDSRAGPCNDRDLAIQQSHAAPQHFPLQDFT